MRDAERKPVERRINIVTKTSDQGQLDHTPAEKGVRQRTGMRGIWKWYGAAVGIVVLVVAIILYVVGGSDPVTEEPVAAEPPATTVQPEQPAVTEALPADVSAADEATHDAAEGSLATAPGSTSSVLLGMFVVDSFGFHGMEEAYAEATEVGDRDAGGVAKVLTAVDAVEWPDELSAVAGTFRADVAGLHAALESGDLAGARHGLEAVHGSQHDLSNGVYAWLAGTPVALHEAEPSGPMEVIEIEMFEYGYGPDSIDIQAGVPVILRFTNTGSRTHEAMVGDAHMQEEFAAGGNHDDAGGAGDHHGDLMAVTVLPGETVDLEVVIDQPGTSYMACHLFGHYERGQVATINVTS
jgi:uncharacterized cupredoxin-like copper-binding protein